MFDRRNDLPPDTRVPVIEQQIDTIAEPDLFTGISRRTDRERWFLEAHLHSRR